MSKLTNINRFNVSVRSAALFGKLLDPVEEQILKKVDSRPEHSIVFILGAPRSGTTALYQTLTDQLDVGYIDNLSHIFYRNILFGFDRSRKKFGNRSHGSFSSNEGYTWRDGLHAPSECGPFWYRFIPKLNRPITEKDIDPVKAEELKRTLVALTKIAGRPMLIKNLLVAERLFLIKNILPNAKFIWIKRNPFYTVQSLIIARNKLGVKENEWWSVKPHNLEQIQGLDYHERLVAQVYHVNKQIKDELADLDPTNFTSVDYNEFCEVPEQFIETIQKQFGLNRSEHSSDLPDLRRQENIKLDPGMVEKLNQAIAQYDFDNLYG